MNFFAHSSHFGFCQMNAAVIQRGKTCNDCRRRKEKDCRDYRIYIRNHQKAKNGYSTRENQTSPECFCMISVCVSAQKCYAAHKQKGLPPIRNQQSQYQNDNCCYKSQKSLLQTVSAPVDFFLRYVSLLT